MPSKNKKQKGKKRAAHPVASAPSAAAQQNAYELDTGVEPDPPSDSWDENDLQLPTPVLTSEQHSGSNNNLKDSCADPAADKNAVTAVATKDSTERQYVFYGPPICLDCGERAHLVNNCTTPYCVSCDKWGHAKGQCNDACEVCGRPHERRDGLCRTFLCPICGLYGHRPSQCPGMECSECGCYGHNGIRCQKDKPCPLCGELGHADTKCPLVCSRCDYPGHRTEDCMMKQCDRCSMIGHVAAECLFTNSSGMETPEAESAWADENAVPAAVPAVPAALPAAGLSKATAKPPQHQPTAGQPSAAPNNRQLASVADSNTVPWTRHPASATQSAATPSPSLLPQNVMPPYYRSTASMAPAALPAHAASAPSVAAGYALDRPVAHHRPDAVHAIRGPPPGFTATAAGVHALLPHMQQRGPHPQVPPGFGQLPVKLPAGLPPHLLRQQQSHPMQQAPGGAQPAAADTAYVARTDDSDEEDLDEMLGLLGA